MLRSEKTLEKNYYSPSSYLSVPPQEQQEPGSLEQDLLVPQVQNSQEQDFPVPQVQDSLDATNQ